ncbi:dTMP kinase [Candidatus Njordibacter sp. Uisw_039]|jgi:dTMP kinase|uniref:dTMP kinase n=1 Tax=Candidatus Njordibacter sp. Uisw_039 TaxID=3230972 RepID=UPI003A144F49|tara:strand:+ start:3545 stop:4177 length:633 start_codon:yes stop_codon:yes gene_type:complete
MAPLFISIEGGEGAGKSTSIDYIKQKLEAFGIKCLVTREPGGTPMAEDIRQLLLQHRDETVDPYTELLLMFASRRQHVENVIRPALTAGKWVICDRFTDASFAYQGFGRGVDQDFITSLKSWVHGDLNPNMTLLFDLDVATGMARAGKRSNFDRIETEIMSFFERVRQGYLTQAKTEPQRYRIVDAAQSITDVEHQLDHFLAPLLVASGN